MKKSLALSTCLLCGVGFFLLLTGCESGPSRRHGPPDGMGPEAAPRPIAMQGDAAFFDGQLVARVYLTRGIHMGGKPGGGSGEDRGSGKGGGMGRGGGRRGGGMGGGPGMGGPGMEGHGGEGGGMPRHMGGQLGSTMPPVTLRLELVNQTKEGSPAVVEVVDFVSDLGNFALKPDRITLAPGQTGGPERVVSRLGVTSDEIPVKVTLRLAGRKELQTVVLRHTAVPAQNAEPPPPPTAP
ncbi:MAG: hypothetical protein HZA31_10090 [Opitutae bacterium]|nr:hypothetical protein [Opitutae bacterium]